MSNFAGSLDANVLLRLLLNDEPAQHQAAKKLFESARGQLAVADTAIIEIAFVLERPYKFSRVRIEEAINGVLLLPKINANRVLFERALVSFVAHPSLSMEDCCLAAYAYLNDALPLWTFDKKLAHQNTDAKLVIE